MSDDVFKAVASARRREEAGFRWLFERYEPELLAVLRHRFPALQIADRESIASEAFLNAFNRIDALRDDEAFWSWLRTSAIRSAIKAVSRAPEPPAPIDPAELSVLPRPAEQLPDPVQREAELRAVNRVLAEMPDPSDARLAAMFYLEDRSRAEIADILMLTEAQVRSRLHRLRGRIRGPLMEALVIAKEEVATEFAPIWSRDRVE